MVSVITPISYDHTATLGESLSQIAWHKAGILRPQRTGVSAPQVDEARLVIEREAHRLGASLETVGREWTWTECAPCSIQPANGVRIASGSATRIETTRPDFEPLETTIGLLGDHQRDNATTAVAALHALAAVDPRLKVARQAIRDGLAHVEWPGRLQILASRPLVVLDGAHNAASARVLQQAIDKHLEFARMHLVVGLSEGKDARGVLDALAPRAHTTYLTRSRHERSADPADLARLVGARARVEGSLSAALGAALAAAARDDLILVTGSLFLVGEALEWWRHSPR